MQKGAMLPFTLPNNAVLLCVLAQHMAGRRHLGDQGHADALQHNGAHVHGHPAHKEDPQGPWSPHQRHCSHSSGDNGAHLLPQAAMWYVPGWRNAYPASCSMQVDVHAAAMT